MTDEELIRAMRKLDWWHSIPLRDGIMTPGKSYNLHVQDLLKLPDMKGKEVLDIGAWDGGYSFHCEKLGASRVVANDLWEQAGRDSFDFAREILDSKIEPVQGSFTDLPETERFDIVLFLGVLYHLKDPLGGLEKVASLVKPGGLAVIDTVVDVKSLFERATMAFYPGAELNSDPTNWWVPNIPALTSMMAVAGFDRIESVVQLYGGDRTIAHGIKMSDRDYRLLKEGLTVRVR